MILGIFLFAMQAMRGDLMAVFTDPKAMALGLFAFLPAAVFAYVAEHNQKKLNKILGRN